jgi:GTP pyrophosphokinase
VVGANSQTASPESAATQTETVRKMLLAFSRDLRVVMLRLASRLQTLRYFAATKIAGAADGMAREALQVFAPLANRLGIWEIKWEMEDLAFRFLEPDTYRRWPAWLDEKRVEREANVASSCVSDCASNPQLRQGMQCHGHGAPQAHLQHRQEDARQVARL